MNGLFKIVSRMFQGKVVSMSRTIDLRYKVGGYAYQKGGTPLKVVLVWKDNPIDVRTE